MAKKEKPAPVPDDLVRTTAGSYRSGDGRFEVQRADQGWFLVDSQQANEFGQHLIHGPFATLDDVRAAVPGSRDIKPLLRSARRPSAAKSANAGVAAHKPTPKKPAPPPSWIDRLPKKEAADVRSLVRALEGEGVANAEAVIKRDRDSSPIAPAASALIETRLKQLIADAPEGQRDAVRRAIKRAAEILTDEGAATARSLPRWELVETPRDPAQPPRRIRLRP
ncbi:MAG: hypothetical protein ABI797_03570 [Chloroflexota bacterium]